MLGGLCAPISAAPVRVPIVQLPEPWHFLRFRHSDYPFRVLFSIESKLGAQLQCLPCGIQI